jgi:hypothetical protein
MGAKMAQLQLAGKSFFRCQFCSEISVSAGKKGL